VLAWDISVMHLWKHLAHSVSEMSQTCGNTCTCSYMHVVLHFIAMELVECYCIVTHCIIRNACWMMGRYLCCCHSVVSSSVARKALFKEKKTLELFGSDMLVLVTLSAN
jgi:hypothetical protein